MAGKPQSTYYSEFRNFAEYMRKGKFRIRRELLPALAAYLTMIGRRYERAVEGIRAKLVQESVPGLEGMASRLEVCVSNIQGLLNLLPQNFSHDDWQGAVTEIATMMGIHGGMEPIQDIPDDQFQALLGMTDDGSDTAGTGNDVRASVGAGPTGGSERPGREPGRRGRGGKKGVGKAPRHR